LNVPSLAAAPAVFLLLLPSPAADPPSLTPLSLSIILETPIPLFLTDLIITYLADTLPLALIELIIHGIPSDFSSLFSQFFAFTLSGVERPLNGTNILDIGSELITSNYINRG